MKKAQFTALHWGAATALFSILSIGFNSCAYDTEEELYPLVVSADEVSWITDVEPIIDLNCALSGCHLDVQQPLLNTYEEVSGKLSVIKERALVRRDMPPTGPLSASDRKKLGDWIEAGGPNN